jgi:hypothetical protein
MNRIFLAATTAILVALVLFSLGCSSNERRGSGLTDYSSILFDFK